MLNLPPVYYVAGLLFADASNQVLLVRKSHPDWMKGKLNGIGGHIELGESPLEAMVREWKEETQLTAPTLWLRFATLSGETEGKGWVVHWFTSSVQRSIDYRAIGSPDEPVNWWYMSELLEGDSNTTATVIRFSGKQVRPPLMPNLRWLIFMAKAHLEKCGGAINGSDYLEVIEHY